MLMSAKEIYEELGGVWGEDCPKYKTTKTWAREFRRTRTNTCRELGSGRQTVLPHTKASTLFTTW